MIEDDEIVTSIIDPIILEIFLYNNNYKDRILISEIKEKAQTIRIPDSEDSSFFVKVDDMWSILNDKFKKDIKNFESTPKENLSSSITSIFFIDSMMKTFDSLKYFKIKVSDSEIYTRKNKDVIHFGYRILHSKVDLTEVLSDEDLEVCKDILIQTNIISTNLFEKTPYVEVYAKDLFNSIKSYYATLDKESDEALTVLNFLSIFGNKLERDDSMILIVFER